MLAWQYLAFQCGQLHRFVRLPPVVIPTSSLWFSTSKATWWRPCHVLEEVSASCSQRLTALPVSWPQAVPISSITAKDCAAAFFLPGFVATVYLTLLLRLDVLCRPLADSLQSSWHYQGVDDDIPNPKSSLAHLALPARPTQGFWTPTCRSSSGFHPLVLPHQYLSSPELYPLLPFRTRFRLPWLLFWSPITWPRRRHIHHLWICWRRILSWCGQTITAACWSPIIL
jgi:hypothetical protein